MTAGGTLSREEQKEKTRRALLDAVLELIAAEHSFSSVSLREVTRLAGVVPTAFYRHFPDMEALGLALVDECFRTLRDQLRLARTNALPNEQLLRNSVQAYFGYVHYHRLFFQFLARERFGGMTALRNAIRTEIRILTGELATDLARLPLLAHLHTDDLLMIAGLTVNAVSAATEFYLDLRDDQQAEIDALIRQTEMQARVIFLGAVQWRPSPP